MSRYQKLQKGKYSSFVHSKINSSNMSKSGYVFTVVIDVAEGVANLHDAISSCAKVHANIDAYDDALVLLYDLAIMIMLFCNYLLQS